MYTVYDFINNNIETKYIHFGWKIEVTNMKIVMRYTLLNFDWKSLDFLGYEAMNMFLNSSSYQNMKKHMDRAKTKFSRLYLEAKDIFTLKALAEYYKLKVDIDRLVAKTRLRKSEAIQQKIDNKFTKNLDCVIM